MRRYSQRTRWAAASVALGTLVYFLFLVVAPGSPRSVTAINDIGQAVVPLLATVVLLITGLTSTGRLRTCWLLLGCAALSWGIGQVIWTWYEVVLDQEVPYPGFADIGYLGAVPFLLAAVLLFPSRSLRTMGRVRAVTDGLMTLFTVAFVGYATFLGVIYTTSEGDAFERALAVVYPAADVLTVAIVLAVLARRVDRLGGPLPVVAAGVMSLAVADSAFAYMTAKGTYGNDPVTDLGWPLGFALLAVAATMSGDDAAESSTRQLSSSWLSVSLPYLPLIPGVAVFVALALEGEAMGPFLAITSSAAALLLVGRQMLTMLENRELTGSLEETVAELRERESQLEFQAFHDPLTQLANRALFRDRLDHALEQRRGEAVSVLFVDLDDFKTVNDSLGHDAGDRLLGSVGERLRACVRVGDTVARLGGDEFAILIEGDADGHEGPVIAQRVLSALAVPFSLAGRDLRVSASLGLASGRYESGTGVLQDADLAMYAAKANGKARVEVFEPTMRTTAVDRMELVLDVQAAVEAGEMRVHLQPIVDLETLEVEGHEALVRWEHPQRGMLGPDSFITIAEETGAIVPMGWWVLERACEQAQTWPSGQIGVNMAAAAAAGSCGRHDGGRHPHPHRHRPAARRARDHRVRVPGHGGDRPPPAPAARARRAPRHRRLRHWLLVAQLSHPAPGRHREDRSLLRGAARWSTRRRGPGARPSCSWPAAWGCEASERAWRPPAQLQRLQSFGCNAAQGYLFGPPAVEPLFDLGSLRALRSDGAAERRLGRRADPSAV